MCFILHFLSSLSASQGFFLITAATLIKNSLGEEDISLFYKGEHTHCCTASDQHCGSLLLLIILIRLVTEHSRITGVLKVKQKCKCLQC